MPLRLRKRKGSPHYYLRGTIRGVAVDESTGTDSKPAADAIRIKREAGILNRSIHGAASQTGFLEAAVGYLENGGERRFMIPLLDHFGATRLSDIDQQAIERAAIALYPGRAPATINRQLYTPMSAIIAYGAGRNMCAPLRLRRPRETMKPVRWMRPDEAEALIEACAPHLQPLVIFLLGTGARLSEALYLDWREVDLGARRVWFPQTKTGKARGVPLNSRVVAALAGIAHREGEVFRTQAGRPYSARPGGGGQIKTGFTAACRRAGITGFTPHGCRHTWATWFYAATRDLRALMELGGWASESMVVRYTHVNPDHLHGLVEALPWAQKREISGKPRGAKTKSTYK